MYIYLYICYHTSKYIGIPSSLLYFLQTWSETKSPTAKSKASWSLQESQRGSFLFLCVSVLVFFKRIRILHKLEVHRSFKAVFISKFTYFDMLRQLVSKSNSISYRTVWLSAMQRYISFLKSHSSFSTSAHIKSPGFIHKTAAVPNADALIPAVD